VLHCNAQLAEMREVAAAVPALGGAAAARADRALARRGKAAPRDLAAMRAEFADLLEPNARRAAS